MAYTTINKSTAHFNIITYTGNSSQGRSITGVGFAPDLVWAKCNSNGGNSHILSDKVRGTNKNLQSNTNSAEIANNAQGYISAFGSDGFTAYGGGSGYNEINGSGNKYVIYNWKGNGSGSSNTAGSINSTVSVNTTSGFSIVKWQGTDANATVGHGLSKAPSMVLYKTLGVGENWIIYNKDLGSNKFTNLNSNGGSTTSTAMFQNTHPSNTLLYVGGNSANKNTPMIAYCFANTTGFSKFGTYKGSANASKGFVYTGFKPQFMMSANTQSDSNWMMWDNKRPGNTFNARTKWIHANGNDQEYTQANSVNFLSNGFSFGVTGHPNEAEEYTYMCFGQSLVGSNNVPATAE